MTDLALWARHAAGDPDARATLLARHLSLVHHVARQLARGLADDADLGELVSAGSIGLLNALASFDASRGLAFSTYAVTRIRGAILDELRRQDHVPRSVRRKTRDIAAARESLTRSLGRAPGDTEVAGHLQVDVATMWRWEAEVDRAVHVPLERPARRGRGAAPTPADYLSAGDEGADARLAREEELRLLRQAIAALREQERTVLSLCYYEELRLGQVAALLGLTDSRVSQIRARALARLREAMAPLRASA